MADSDSGPRNITTDQETIKEWVETRDGTPARVIGQADEPGSLYVVRKDEPMEGMEALSWDEFFETFETEELAFIYADQEPEASDEWFYDLVDRTEIAERTELDSTEVEQSLLEGEVVRSELTETTVIEKTVVETDQIESQIVDSELIETNLLNHEIQQRELVGATFAGSDVPTTLRGEMATGDSGARTDERMDSDDDESLFGDEDDGILSDDEDDGILSDDDDEGMLSDDDESLLGDDDQGVLGEDEPEADDSVSTSPADGTPTETPSHSPVERSTESPAGLGVDEHLTLEVQDSVRTTMEVFDRKIVESRVVDRDIIESDSVESDAIDIDMEGVEETILESDLIEGELAGTTAETTASETIPSGAITSERTEGDVIRSQFVERRIVETDSTEHRELTCEITDSHLLEAVDNRSQVVERAIVDRDAGEEALFDAPSAGTEEVSAAEASAAASEKAHQAADAETGVIAGGEAGETGTMDDEQPAQPTEDEIGKTVISGDEEVGLVSDVQDGTLYVEADPSLTDRIKAAFEWGEAEESYPVEPDQIESISDDAVHIREI